MNFASNFALCAILMGRGAAKQFPQRPEVVVVGEVTAGERVDVDDEHTCGRSELDQPQPSSVRLEIGGLWCPARWPVARPEIQQLCEALRCCELPDS